MSEQRRLILALVLIAAIFGFFQIFIEGPRMRERQAALEAQRQAQEQSQTVTPGQTPGEALPTPPQVAATAPTAPRSRAELVGDARLRFENARIEGSIDLMGGRFNNLLLKNYRLSVDPQSDRVNLLNPVGGADPYFADFGWVAEGGASVKLPDAESRWSVDKDSLTPGAPIVMTWSNGEGLTFRRMITLDDNYMFTVEQSVVNETGAPVTLFPYGLIARLGLPRTGGVYILHEGPLGVFRDDISQDGVLTELNYSDMVGEPARAIRSVGGWIGLTDHYWLTALIPAQDAPVTARFNHVPRPDLDRFQTDLMGAAQTVAPGQTASYGFRFFAGAKEANLLDRYQDELGIIRFDRAIDWGWFYFLTRPMFWVLDQIYQLVGNFGVAILLLTVIVKLVFFPLANKSYASMSAMKKLQPELLKLRERYADDRQKLSQAMMELYKREKVNPASGCLPILVQIPVFFALYKVLYVTIEMRHAPFFGWIQDLSAPDPTSWINLFGLLPFDVPNLGPLLILSIGIWPILMGISMWLQFKLNPAPPDPIQAKIFGFMPLIFTFMLGQFAAGLVIYWTWNNLLSIAQQWAIMKRHGVKNALS